MGNEVKPADRQGLSRSGRPSVFKSKNWALRVVLFFARNPEEELTTTDIALKFAIPPLNVRSTLAIAVANGMLRRRGGNNGGRGKLLIYSAGDTLLSLIGERRLLEDRRAEERETPDRRVGTNVLVLMVEACAPLAGVAEVAP